MKYFLIFLFKLLFFPQQIALECLGSFSYFFFSGEWGEVVGGGGGELTWPAAVLLMG